MAGPRDVMVITVSDRVAHGDRPNAAGERLVELWTEAGWNVTGSSIIEQDEETVLANLQAGLAAGNLVVITCGGTGVMTRDRTPEATRRIVTRELLGVAEHLRREGARYTPLSALSRGIVGVVDDHNGRPTALVVNLPGSVGGVEQGSEALFPLLKHILRQFDE